MTPAAALRSVAIAIAVAAFVDPAVTIAGRTRPRIALVSESGLADAEDVRRRLASDLDLEFDVVPRLDSSASATVVIGNAYPSQYFSEEQRVFTVTLESAASPNVRIIGVDAPARTPLGSLIHLDAVVEGSGMAGKASHLTVRAAGVEVGRASHTWRSDRERWHAALDVVPAGEPPFVLRVESPALSVERIAADNAADVTVDAEPSPLRVLVYEPRPSWASTFVRRALEGDARFRVASLSDVSRGVRLQANLDPLNGAAAGLSRVANLDRFDAIVVGGLERLSAADANALDRFMRERGGSVTLLPDSRIDGGAARDLIPAGALTEVLLEKPAALATPAGLPPFSASEILTFRDLAPGAEVFARTNGSNDPVVVVSPYGDGRLLTSGALDAWRFRGDGQAAFDRFWQSVIAGLALASPPPVSVVLSPALLAPGETGRVAVRIRRTALDPSSGNPPPISASMDDGVVVRLWPQAERGVFIGSVDAPAQTGRHHVTVDLGGAAPSSVARAFVVQRPIASGSSSGACDLPRLALLSASHAGIDVTPDRLTVLEQHLRKEIVGPSTRTARHPMRAAWWMIPFAGCLAGEWWLRRRIGLR